MQLYNFQEERSGAITIGSGLVLIAAILIMQHLSVTSLSAGTSGNIVLSSDKAKEFSDAAFPTFAITLIAVGISLIGASRILHFWKESSNDGMINQRRTQILQRASALIGPSFAREKKVFWLSLFSYAIIFLFSSGMVIYSQENISNRYGVPVPSYFLTGCCGQPGSFPVLTVYLSQHFGLLLVPMNLILVSFLSVLVAINISVFVYLTKLSRAKKDIYKSRISRNISVCGLSVGMVAGCPTCAGSVLFSLIGSGSFSSLGIAGATISNYQPVFVIVSIGMLLAAPLASTLRR
jgi:hypothetical protein